MRQQLPFHKIFLQLDIFFHLTQLQYTENMCLILKARRRLKLLSVNRFAIHYCGFAAVEIKILLEASHSPKKFLSLKARYNPSCIHHKTPAAKVSLCEPILSMTHLKMIEVFSFQARLNSDDNYKHIIKCIYLYYTAYLIVSFVI